MNIYMFLLIELKVKTPDSYSFDSSMQPMSHVCGEVVCGSLREMTGAGDATV